MKPRMNTAHWRRLLAVAAVTAGLAVTGCATSPPNAPSPPVVSGTPPAQPQESALDWAASMCQALRPAFVQLGTPPQADVNNPAATRQAFITYLDKAGNAAQQTIDRVSSVGAPPVDNGQQILDQIRNQLVELRTNLTDAAAQLKAANSNDSSAIGRALSAVGNVVSLLGTLNTNPQLRAAIDQAPECQSLASERAGR
jgi:hypothetical protein